MRETSRWCTVRCEVEFDARQFSSDGLPTFPEQLEFSDADGKLREDADEEELTDGERTDVLLIDGRTVGEGPEEGVWSVMTPRWTDELKEEEE